MDFTYGKHLKERLYFVMVIIPNYSFILNYMDEKCDVYSSICVYFL